MSAMRVVVTRPQPGLGQTAARLKEMGIEPVLLLLSRIVPLGDGLAAAAADVPDALIVTSAAAIRAVAGQIGYGVTLWAVGAATAEAARRAGFRDVIEGPGNGAGTAEAILAHDGGDRARRWTYLASRVRTLALEERLVKAGLNLRVVEVYDVEWIDQTAEDIEKALYSPPADAVLFYSREAAQHFSTLCVKAKRKPLEPTRLLCLSDNVAAGLVSLAPANIAVAAQPSEVSLLRLLGESRNQRV